MPAGYSGTPLAKKLGLKENFSVLLYNEPSHYLGLFADFPENIIFREDGKNESIDFIHLFCTTLEELQTSVSTYKPLLKKTGLLWISWPKGSSKIKTDLKREPVRDYLLGVALVDVKVAAIDDNWSGLKFVYRLKDR
jgi:hypothetical protein